MKIDRLISIIMLLLDKQRIGAQELADMFEVSPRTIYRDIESINESGIPILSTSGVGGGFEIMKQYKVDKKVFSSADLSAILTGLSSLSSMIRGDELINAVAKVKSFIPAEKAKDIELKTNQIFIDLSPWFGNKNIQTYLEIIKTALQSSKILSFDYTGRSGGKTLRTVEPYQLVLKNTHWYVHTFCRIKNDFRVFKLSRMSNLVMRDEIFTPRNHEKPQLDITDLASGMQMSIEARVHFSVLDRMLDYCSYEDFKPDGSGWFIVNLPFIENDYYYDMLLSLGDKCECIAPTHIREETKRRIQNIAAMYGA